MYVIIKMAPTLDQYSAAPCAWLFVEAAWGTPPLPGTVHMLPCCQCTLLDRPGALYMAARRQKLCCLVLHVCCNQAGLQCRLMALPKSTLALSRADG